MRLYDNDAYRGEFMGLVYDLLHSDGTNDRANQIIYAFDMAPAVEAEPLPPNDPLTLEELREMDGEPVWYTKWNVYGLVDIELGLVITKIGDVPLNHAGATGSLYRRKPEEATTSSDEETGSQRATEPWKDFLMTRFERKEGPV